MKKYTSTALGGAPVDDDDLLDIFNSEIWSAMQAIMSQFDADTEAVIVSGCVISGGGPYAMTAGVIYIDGEFKAIPAQASFTLPQYIVSDTPVNDSRTYGDGTTNVIAITKSCKIQSTAPGSGQYIAITSTTDPDNRRYKPTLSENTSLRFKKIAMPTWNMGVATSITVAHGLSDYKKILGSPIGIIRNDADSLRIPIGYHTSGASAEIWISNITSTNITIEINATGILATSGSYVSTSFSRGSITIPYEV